MKTCFNIKGITEADCDTKVKPAAKTGYGADDVILESKSTEGDKVKCCIKIKCKDSDQASDINYGMETDFNGNCDDVERADGIKCAGGEILKINRRRLSRYLLTEDQLESDPPMVEVTKKEEEKDDDKKGGYGVGLVIFWIIGILI